jgi:hypothetical protein
MPKAFVSTYVGRLSVNVERKGTMKRIIHLIIFPLVLWGLSLNAAADSNQSGKINVSDRVIVSGTELHPGEYTVRWAGAGPEVQVQFFHDGHEVVSLTGTLLEKRNPYDSFSTRLNDEGTRELSEIAFSRATLLLRAPAAPASD